MEWMLGFIMVVGTLAISGAWKELAAERETNSSEENVFYN
jgi:hypothetical protein